MNSEKLKEKYINLLKEQQISWDDEMAHVEADNLVCELLKELGFEEVVKEYDKVSKWYA